MATQKKGCGFLITALILLIAGGVIAGLLGKSAVTDGKKFKDEISEGSVEFITPETHTYTPASDTFLTVTAISSDTVDLKDVVFTVTDQDGKKISSSGNSSSNFEEETKTTTYQVKKDNVYTISAAGLTDGETVYVSNISQSTAISTIGKGFGALAIFGVAALLSLIFGIVGLVKLLGSRKQTQQNS